MSMYEVDEAARIITETVDMDANIIFGATINEEYNGEMKITVVATWFDEESNSNYLQVESRVPLKSNPFGRKTTTDSRITSTAPKTSSDDLDVPTFLRKKM